MATLVRTQSLNQTSRAPFETPPMNIKKFIIHRIDKKQHEDPSVTIRKAALAGNDGKVVKFTKLAVEVFRTNEDKPNCVFADFNSETAAYPFSSWCLDFFNGKRQFNSFTSESTHRLSACMKAQQMATGGFVVFATLEEDGVDKILIVMLHHQDGLSINEELELLDVTHLELKQIDKAALITAPKNGTFGEKPLTYAGFRKKMSQYFQEFLGPDAFRNPNKDSRLLVKAIEDYARENNFESDQLGEIRGKLRSYVEECVKKGEELDLDSVSAIVDPVKPRAFASYAGKAKVSATIKPDGGVFKRWRIIRHKSSDGLVIQFAAETVGAPGTEHRLIFDEEKSTLTIRDLDEVLVAKLKNIENPTQ